MSAPISYKSIFVKASLCTAVLGLTLALTYVLFGHALIKAMYDSDISIINRIMAGKASTSLPHYFISADQLVLRAALYCALSAVGLLLLTNPLGLVISATSLLIGSLTIFLLLDLFPEFVKPLHFGVIPYYSYRLSYVADPVLGFRTRPYLHNDFSGYRGSSYSPLYGISVAPESGVWQFDGEGFRNPGDISSALVAVIGSSFVEWGPDVEDTFPMQLEKRLGGQRVVNLAKSGYGPLQYMEILKRYALEKKPRYVIITFYPAGDIDQQLASWVKGHRDRTMAKYTVAYDGFFRRYAIAVQQTSDILISGSWTALQLGFRKIVGTVAVHPDIAVLRLPEGVTKRIFFLDQHSTKSTDNLLRSTEWQVMEKILIDLKHVCEEHQIVPLMLYIPTASEVYAKYSTLESGANWLSVRESRIRSSDNNEVAARTMARKIGIDLISLLPAFKQEAAQGKLVYYQLDPHWNEEGREIAAKVTADALKALRSKAPTVPNIPKESDPADHRRLDLIIQEAMADRQDGIILRSIDGKISFWNPGAQQLYGWRENEAVGKVSHNLLHTQFPEPLEKIDAELVRNGQWQGKLVHLTRDGRRIVVESRWVLDRQVQPGSVVETNTPLG